MYMNMTVPNNARIFLCNLSITLVIVQVHKQANKQDNMLCVKSISQNVRVHE